jgi:hypothetical protein
MLLAESPHCYRGPSVIDTRQLKGSAPIDQRVVGKIERRIPDMRIEETLRARDLPLNLNDSPEYPVLQCNVTRADEWKRLTANVTLAKNRRRLDYNRKRNFTMHAMEAARRTIRAFRLAKVPLLVVAGTTLGWYRECGITAHTEDIDFTSMSDHIVSMEHFHVLMVCFELMACFTAYLQLSGSLACVWYFGAGPNIRTSSAAGNGHHNVLLSNVRIIEFCSH